MTSHLAKTAFRKQNLNLKEYMYKTPTVTFSIAPNVKGKMESSVLCLESNSVQSVARLFRLR
jgi:hypothetical protein